MFVLLIEKWRQTERLRIQLNLNVASRCWNCLNDHRFHSLIGFDFDVVRFAERKSVRKTKITDVIGFIHRNADSGIRFFQFRRIETDETRVQRELERKTVRFDESTKKTLSSSTCFICSASRINCRSESNRREFSFSRHCRFRFDQSYNEQSYKNTNVSNDEEISCSRVNRTVGFDF